jgi:hypothetical protein
MMITKKSEIATSAPKSSSKHPSLFSFAFQQQHSYMIWTIYVLIFVVIFTLFLQSVVNVVKSAKKSKEPPSPLDNKLVVGRFKRAYNIWNTVATDPMFVVLTKTLMEINSKSAVNGFVDKGSKDIYDAFTNLDRYVNENLKFPENVRITVMYNDGIVFYDSILKVNEVYFMKEGLPRPVNLYTLGSPLKDHNMLPEVANSVIITDSSDNSLSGMMLTDPFYRKIVNEGYGFAERISSTFNRPYTYLAHILQLGIDPATAFVNTITVRVGLPVESKA